MAIETVWGSVKNQVINFLKIEILKYHVEDVLEFFKNRLNIVVKVYVRYLPNYVADSEIDDLKTVACLELVESVKVWDLEKSDEIWPYAQMRIKGALKDHIRFITKTDPSRVYEWISDAAHLYRMVEDMNEFESKFEYSDQLNVALEGLSFRERRIVIYHTKSDFTFRQIGEKLGISESQISRIYKKAIQKLKKIMS